MHHPMKQVHTFIYEHLGSVDKELNGLKDSHHLMTHGEGRDILEEHVIRFSML